MFLSATIAVAAFQHRVLATKAEGYKSISLATGRLDESGTSSLLAQQQVEAGNDPVEVSAQKRGAIVRHLCAE